nr:hypothetical protein [Tanacetum cinerariifolium]
VDTYAEWGQKLKGPAVDDLAVQSLLDLQEGSKASRHKSLKQKKQAVIGEGSSAAHNKYFDSSDNDSEATLYSSGADELKESVNETDDTLLDETHATELTKFMSHLVYVDSQTTLVVHNPEGNPELTSYISCSSKVPLGTHVDVLATKTLLQEIFPNENAHHIPFLLAKKNPYPTTTPQPSSLQAKVKRLMQKEKQNMRKINFNKAQRSLKNDPKGQAYNSRSQSTRLKWLKVQYNNDVELEYHLCQLKVAVLSKAQWNGDEGDISKPISFERNMSKSTKQHPCFYNNDYTYLVDLSTEEKYTTSITKHYAARYYKEEDKNDFFKAGISVITEGNAYSDLRIKSVVRVVRKKKLGYGFLTSIVVMRFDDKEYEFSYADLPRRSKNDVKDIRTVIKNKVEDIQLGVESYQRTLNLTKPTMFFVGIDQRIPFTEMMKKIDEILRHKEQLRRLEEYVGRLPRLLILVLCKFYVITPYGRLLKSVDYKSNLSKINRIGIN